MPARPLARGIQVFVTAAFFSCAPGSQHATTSKGLPERVSLVALVANPQAYDGEEVHVTAWAVIEQEGAALYVSQSDRRHLVTEAGVWLDLPPGEHFAARLGYLTVQGHFRAGDDIHGYAGRLTDVTKVILLDPELPPEPAYFLSFSGYSIPLVLVDPVSKAEAEREKDRSYYRAEYDADGRVIVVEKHLRGSVIGRHEYFYHPNGELREMHVTSDEGRVVVHLFDESGKRLDSR